MSWLKGSCTSIFFSYPKSSTWVINNNSWVQMFQSVVSYLKSFYELTSCTSAPSSSWFTALNMILLIMITVILPLIYPFFHPWMTYSTPFSYIFYKEVSLMMNLIALVPVLRELTGLEGIRQIMNCLLKCMMSDRWPWEHLDGVIQSTWWRIVFQENFSREFN